MDLCMKFAVSTFHGLFKTGVAVYLLHITISNSAYTILCCFSSTSVVVIYVSISLSISKTLFLLKSLNLMVTLWLRTDRYNVLSNFWKYINV